MAAVILVVLASAVLAQHPAKSAPTPLLKPVTVPIAFDQGRIVIDVDLPLANGSVEHVRGWVDSGNPDLWMSQRVAQLLGMNLACEGPICSGSPKSLSVPLEAMIGGMRIELPTDKEIRIPAGKSALAPGMSAEINLPASVLRNYAVLVNLPDREFTIGPPGSLKFNGIQIKMLLNASNGMIQIASKIDNKNYDLGLGLGSSINFLSEELFDKLSNAHPDWPHMTGVVGPFNTSETSDEPNLKLMRIGRLQYGPLFLTDVAIARVSKDRNLVLADRASLPSAGLLGSEALMNYRVGLDYSHSQVYFDIGRTTALPEFDVVGLVLRAEDDNRFTIIGVADFDGKASVPEVQAGDHLLAVGDSPVADFTLGQVWALLEGSPGQERRLTIERGGRQFTVIAKVQNFLGSPPAADDSNRNEGKKKTKKN